MIITFVCQSCDNSFEINFVALAEETKGLKCPSCGKKLSLSETEEFVAALDEALSQVAAIRKRFAVSLEIDAEDLPPPYDVDIKRAARDDDDDADSDDDEEGLDDELAEDEDDERA